MSGIGQSIIDILTKIVIWAPGLVMGVVIHECAHGYLAYKSGDPTAKNMGRLTLNPVAHIDLFGSIILPLFLLLLNSSILFGYAKPVPINTAYFKNYRKGIRYTSLAGPAANLIFAFVVGLIYGIFYFIFYILIGVPLNINTIGYRAFILISLIFQNAIFINIFLAIFNFIPIPPLDGSKILASFLPQNAMYKYLSMERYGFIFIFLFIFLFSKFLGSVITPVANFFYNMCTWWQYLI
ncbi:MAG: site-2 protease family protein [Actinomycetota bacterium]|jgi:Zn-dependent protease|nr:site-2 protease family protein [Actinomycetota bacterium]